MREKYELMLISQAQSINKRPVPRDELIEVFGLKGVNSRIFPKHMLGTIGDGSSSENQEVWVLNHDYQLVAATEAELKESIEFKRKYEKWRRTASERDYLIVEYAPILLFKEFSIISPTNKKIYPLIEHSITKSKAK